MRQLSTLLSIGLFLSATGSAVNTDPVNRYSTTLKNEQKSKTPETDLLMTNDGLFPGQNRPQAMSLETETGHLTPEEDAVLIPLLRQKERTHH